MQIPAGGFNRAVTKPSFDDEQLHSLIKQVGGKAVAQGMNTAALGEPAFALAW